ncbi:uncharacterized protein IUM83_03689 [Phytophthora cinnamomi]|uniref:uncharacterized protein n=1 Tax=Phytophthora cinnamomi TaxID=4785 RepID=UPI00355A247E|nr:hypothetical protein IUM83_03689 [Phytophthora cinnamomi]
MLGSEAAWATSLRRTATGRCGGDCVRSSDAACHDAERDEAKRRPSVDLGDLGPPPPSCPVLCRQKATDFTAARERKRAGLSGQEPLRGGPAGLGRQPSVLARVGRRMPAPTEHCPLMM